VRRRLDVLCGPAPIVPGMRLWGRVRGSHRLPGGVLLIHPDHAPVVLAALDDAAYYRMDTGHPVRCGCPDHAADRRAARTYEKLAALLRPHRARQAG
jgi:hypothetical protein